MDLRSNNFLDADPLDQMQESILFFFFDASNLCKKRSDSMPEILLFSHSSSLVQRIGTYHRYDILATFCMMALGFVDGCLKTETENKPFPVRALATEVP